MQLIKRRVLRHGPIDHATMRNFLPRVAGAGGARLPRQGDAALELRTCGRLVGQVLRRIAVEIPTRIARRHVIDRHLPAGRKVVGRGMHPPLQEIQIAVVGTNSAVLQGNEVDVGPLRTNVDRAREGAQRSDTELHGRLRHHTRWGLHRHREIRALYDRQPGTNRRFQVARVLDVHAGFQQDRRQPRHVRCGHGGS